MATAAASNSELNQAEQDSSSSSPAATYTVVCRNVVFTLTRSQFETDSPNYFTTCFLSSSFAESTSHTVHTDRNPDLFALIVEHLSGYDILPLSKEALPKTMSEEAARRNLLKDAEYFQLEGLCKELKTSPIALPTGQEQGVFQTVMGQASTTVSFDDFSSAFSRFLHEHWPLEGTPPSFPLPWLLLLKRIAIRFSATANPNTFKLEIADFVSSLQALLQEMRPQLSSSVLFDLTSDIFTSRYSKVRVNGSQTALQDLRFYVAGCPITTFLPYSCPRGAETPYYFADLLCRPKDHLQWLHSPYLLRLCHGDLSQLRTTSQGRSPSAVPARLGVLPPYLLLFPLRLLLTLPPAFSP